MLWGRVCGWMSGCCNVNGFCWEWHGSDGHVVESGGGGGGLWWVLCGVDGVEGGAGCVVCVVGEREVFNPAGVCLVHSLRSCCAFVFYMLWQGVEVEKFFNITAGGGEVEAGDFLKLCAWVCEVGRLAWAILVHESCVVGVGDVWEKGRVICPGFLVCRKRLVVVEGNVGNEGTDAIIVKIHRVDVGNRDAANAVDDDIVLVHC